MNSDSKRTDMPIKILDRYLTREFLKSLIFSQTAFVLIFVLVDIFEKLDMFIDHRAPYHLVALFYIYQIPYIMILTLPVAMLLASMATISQMARHHEIVAMKAAGLSLYRIFAPLFILGLLISLAVMAVGETIVPITNQKKGNLERIRIKKQLSQEPQTRFNLLYDGSQGRQFFIKRYNVEKAVMDSVSIFQVDQQNRILQRIDAAKGVWTGNVWLLEKVIIRNFRPDGTEISDSLQQLKLTGYEEAPASFSKRELLPDEMGFFELRQFIDRLKRSGNQVQQSVVDLYLKLSFPFANFIILLFGLPLLSNSRKGSTASGFAISLLTCFVFWGLLQTGRALGHSATLSPILAAWLPNIIFGAIGAFLLYRAPK
ncbi:TPA: LPS export ABC transporter permease LptG [Candidatus Edwardsbacteria bacterium]|nr:LPS export ABC transporter permease LptG [Candidatus Edwardsbacteria bacterium]HBZ87482.1 LPS export ABC transporter permease LptG [Candidatus Edwardsbacteria bacterium]